jgi:cyclopropane-fatty-acyl-phospholipid synthase
VARIYKEAFKLFFFRKLGYNPKPEPQSPMTIGRISPTIIQTLSMKKIEKVLTRIEKGFLTATYPDGSVRNFGNPDSRERADITINGYSFFSRILFNGEIGFGESFMEHGWDSSDPVRLILFFIKNLDLDEDNHVALKTVNLTLNRLLNRRKRNTINGSRKNIGEHYDLGNDFFREFLDRRLLYSCGIFRKKQDTLEQAQLNKIREIIDRAGISKGHLSFEIGFGWGGFAIETAKRTGCRVTTITLSKEQHDYVEALIKKEGLGKRVNVEIIDYRHMTGSFDRIVSIEMLEAVGHENFSSYFRAIDRLLKPDGIAVIQVITTMDHHYRDYKRRIDWIQKHIFPGGHLPSVTALSESMARNSRFYVEFLENIGPHYAPTLREWRRRFTASSEHLMSLGYDGKFQRKWLYYLYVCEAGFSGRIINDVIITLARPGGN